MEWLGGRRSIGIGVAAVTSIALIADKVFGCYWTIFAWGLGMGFAYLYILVRAIKESGDG